MRGCLHGTNLKPDLVQEEDVAKVMVDSSSEERNQTLSGSNLKIAGIAVKN